MLPLRLVMALAALVAVQTPAVRPSILVSAAISLTDVLSEVAGHAAHGGGEVTFNLRDRTRSRGRLSTAHPRMSSSARMRPRWVVERAGAVPPAAHNGR